MQLTKFDRWLRERFIYRTHIYTMRMPEAGIPSTVMVEELEDSPTRKFRFRMVANADHDVAAVLTALREGNQMFATRIVETNPWYRSIIAPEGKSFFFRIVWITIALIGLAVVIILALRVMADETLMKQLKESLNLFMEG
jgi:hypothetical protein